MLQTALCTQQPQVLEVEMISSNEHAAKAQRQLLIRLFFLSDLLLM